MLKQIRKTLEQFGVLADSSGNPAGFSANDWQCTLLTKEDHQPTPSEVGVSADPPSSESWGPFAFLIPFFNPMPPKRRKVICEISTRGRSAFNITIYRDFPGTAELILKALADCGLRPGSVTLSPEQPWETNCEHIESYP